MSETTIQFTSKVNGSLVDLTSIHLEDSTDTYGVRRVDNLDVVVPSGTAVPRLSLGLYSYTFTDPEPNLTYEYTIKVVYNGVTYYYNRQNMTVSVSSLILIPNSTHYSSQAEVYRVLGEYAAELMIDDYPTSDTSYIWSDLLYEVDATIWQYVEQHYDPANLYSNQWVRRKATYLVASNLAQRRGNAPIMNSKIDRIYDELNGVRDNRFKIPYATPRAWQGPVVRNYEIQDRFYYHPGRVVSSKSTGDPYAGEDLSWEPYFYSLPQ